MEQRINTELTEGDINMVTNDKRKMNQEQQDKCEGIGKCADMEDKKTMKRRSLSESSTKRTLSSKSLFSNLFSRKKVSEQKANIENFTTLQTFFYFKERQIRGRPRRVCSAKKCSIK